MRRHLALAALALLVTAPAARSNVVARTRVEQMLSGFDYLPSRPTLDAALGGDLTGLVLLASVDNNPAVSPGMRVRAYRALGQFDSDLARAALSNAIVAYRDADAAMARMYLLAAVEALGENGGAAEVEVLASALGNELLDVRAAAALALAETSSAAACPYLRGQNTHETNAQVKAALQTALGRIDPLCITGGR